MVDTFVPALLQQLSDFREYPKYQFERRIDAFVGFFLGDVLQSRYGIQPQFIVPEFPVKAHSTRRLSRNIDYLVYDETARMLSLVELKTDKNSIHENQIRYYVETLDTPWQTICGHVKWVREGSTHKAKYDHLLGVLAKVPDNVTKRAVYIGPTPGIERFNKRFDLVCRMATKDPVIERQRWEYLSLKSFADTKIQTAYSKAWEAVGNTLRAY